jgi:medium-chain acyl-[acyl-carrier-protein] hydrolase
VARVGRPHRPDPEPPLHRLPDPRLVERLRSINGTPQAMLDDPDTLALYLPALRADLALVETYVHASEPPVDCPITAFGGDADTTVPLAAVAAWESRTRGAFALETLPGDHFFLNQSRTQLLAALTRRLTSPTES